MKKYKLINYVYRPWIERRVFAPRVGQCTTSQSVTARPWLYGIRAVSASVHRAIPLDVVVYLIKN